MGIFDARQRGRIYKSFSPAREDRSALQAPTAANNGLSDCDDKSFLHSEAPGRGVIRLNRQRGRLSFHRGEPRRFGRGASDRHAR